MILVGPEKLRHNLVATYGTQPLPEWVCIIRELRLEVPVPGRLSVKWRYVMQGRYLSYKRSAVIISPTGNPIRLPGRPPATSMPQHAVGCYTP